LAGSGEEERKGKAAGRGGAGPGEAEGGRRKEGDGGEANRWGWVVSETKEKKRGSWGAWAAAGRSWWAAGPLGWKGEIDKFLFFLFFFKPISNQTF
jgi:hypothetical protein